MAAIKQPTDNTDQQDAIVIGEAMRGNEMPQFSVVAGVML